VQQAAQAHARPHRALEANGSSRRLLLELPRFVSRDDVGTNAALRYARALARHWELHAQDTADCLSLSLTDTSVRGDSSVRRTTGFGISTFSITSVNTQDTAPPLRSRCDRSGAIHVLLTKEPLLHFGHLNDGTVRRRPLNRLPTADHTISEVERDVTEGLGAFMREPHVDRSEIKRVSHDGNVPQRPAR
jgi:hypothetical protein